MAQRIEITREMMQSHAEEAARHLGYIDMAKIDDFVAWLVALWGSDPRSASFYGTPRPHHVLTPKGMESPNQHVDASFWRATNGLRRQMQRERDLRVMYRSDGSRSPMFAAIMFMAKPQDPCAASAAIHRTIHAEHVALPLPDCDREVCGCQWRLITRRELGKLGG